MYFVARINDLSAPTILSQHLLTSRAQCIDAIVRCGGGRYFIADVSDPKLSTTVLATVDITEVP